ncbi:MAG TPA: hypothetical protein VMF89_01855, partial [Polyangiales bacterium]|nr:hypothetical protein [Polyangiales bacterium]
MSGKSRTVKRSKPHKSSSRSVQSSSERAAALSHAGKLQNAGDLAGASAIYQQILAIDPANENALFLSGLLEHGRGDQHSACAHFERLIKLRDADADYRLWFARILRAKGDSQRALAEARQSRALNPQQESAY